MISKHSPALLTALACVALLAGCGSSSSSSSSTAKTLGATPTSPSSTPTTGPKNLSAASIERCKHGLNVLPNLPQKTKSRLESICEKAASGDAAAARAATREGCEEIIRASPLPAGAARDRALAGCKSAGQK
jgi:hypothetical protein